ncbi:MAG: cytidylate kinase family protein [Proteobacteria bacterium]|nr:cytidylate kinase family protein [Pseudomonadota bacterium]
MITVAQRVSHAIDSIRRGEYEFALEDAAVAIDVTAQRHYGIPRSTKRDYKRFLGEYLWLIELMALNGINLEESFFQNLTRTIPGVPRPRFTDLLYHVVRCGLVHDTGIPSNVEFVPGRILMLADDYIRLPAQVIWGLLAIVVFAKANLAEESAGDYFRQYMIEHGIDLHKKEDLPDKVDRDFDDEVKKTLESTTPIVFEGIYSGYIARDMKHVMRVLLIADEKVRIKRALNRTHTHTETPETVEAKTETVEEKPETVEEKPETVEEKPA